jgi:hydrogenase nickel incorporation protein HypA/HybF
VGLSPEAKAAAEEVFSHGERGVVHEFSLINDLIRKIELIAREQGAQRVAGLRVKLGALSHVSADHFREHFEAAATGTIAEGARLEIEMVTEEYDPHAQDILLDSVEVED